MSRMGRKKSEFTNAVIQRVNLIERREVDERKDSGNAILDQYLEQNNVLLNQIAAGQQETERRATQMKRICSLPATQSDSDRQVRISARPLIACSLL